MNPLAPKYSGRHASGWCAPLGANDNLVIKFSDDDSETDSEEKKNERTSGRDHTGVRVNRHKGSATSSQLNKKILQPVQSIQMETMPQKASSSRTFISSMNKIHGPSFRGFSAAPVPRGPQNQMHVSLIRSSTNQERGSVRVVNSTDTELESLRQQIARRENELKLQRKSIPQTKDIFPSSDGDSHGTKLGIRTTKMSRSASGDAVGLVPKEQERKRKRDELSLSQLSSGDRPQMPKNVKESAIKFGDQVLEQSCCIKENDPMACSQCNKAVPMVSRHPSPSRQPGKGDQLDLVSSRTLVEVEKDGEPSLSFVQTISSSLPNLVEPSNQGHNHLSGGGLTGCCSLSNTSLMPIDSLIGSTASPAKVTSNPEDGALRLLKLSSPMKSVSFNSGFCLSYLTIFNSSPSLLQCCIVSHALNRYVVEVTCCSFV